MIISIRKKIPALLLGLPLMLLGCYPQGPEFVTDTDVVYSNYNNSYNFKANAKFAIPNKIVKITGNVITGDPPKYVPDVLALPMLAQISSNMTAMGYTKVDIDFSNPPVPFPTDILIILPSAMETTTISYWYPYWGWWYGGYYPGWGYPWYGYPVTTSYTTGTLMMNIIDPKLQGGDGNAVSQWTGAINGILTNTYDITRINRGIDQAFKQSPYLKK